MLNRRDFIRSALLFPLISGHKSSFGKKKQYIDHSLIDTYELLGIHEPQLCGSYFCLRNEVAEAFYEMAQYASKDGLDLYCSSGHRSFELQKNIWNAKYKRYKKLGLEPQSAIRKIITYTSVPGTSRHHWGTDLDITDSLSYTTKDPLDVENFVPGSGYQFLDHWLVRNAHKFGFYQVYTNDPERTGFKYEPWHYSYALLSREYLKLATEIEFYKYKKMALCKGNEWMDKLFFQQYVEEYMKGVNPILK